MLVNGEGGAGAVRVGTLSLVAAILCAVMLFADPDGLGLFARVGAAGLCFVQAWMLTRRAAMGPGEHSVWEAFGRGATWVGVALLAETGVVLLIRSGELAPAWAGIGFGLVTLVSWT